MFHPPPQQAIAIDLVSGRFTRPWNNWFNVMADIMERIYPVGSIYISATTTNPFVLFGVGTWTLIEGKYLVGYKSGDADFGTLLASGGAKTHDHDNHTNLTHSGTAVGDHAAQSHSGGAVVRGTSGITVGDHGNHAHTGSASHGGETIAATATGAVNIGAGAASAADQNHTHAVPTLSHGNTGNETAPLTHTVTEPNAGTGHDHSFTQPSDHAALVHSVTQPGDHTISAHSTESNLSPFLVVNIWRRTA
jgi:hypothetical protein